MAQKYPVKRQAGSHYSLVTCLRKQAYRTAEYAHHVRDRMEQQEGAEFRVYYCVYCRGYHVGKPARHATKEA